MSEITVNLDSMPPRRRRWPKVLAWIFGVLLLLVVVLFFVVTSSAFFRGVILPRAGKALNANITVDDASIHPFREITLHQLRVQPIGQEPLLHAPLVRVQYKLWDIVRGRIHVNEAAALDPTVTVVKHPDGSSNLDPLLVKEKEEVEKPPEKAERKEPAQLQIGTLLLSNATVRLTTLYAGGNQDTAELTNFIVRVTHLQNGQSGKLTLRGDVRMDRNPPGRAEAGQADGVVNGAFDFTLLEDLKPASLQGRGELLISRAQGAMQDLSGFTSTLSCSMTPTEIKELALRFNRNQETLGELLASGPFNVERNEGLLVIRLQSVDQRLLNLLAAGAGLKFGDTQIRSETEVNLAQAGQQITVRGRFGIKGFQVARAGQTSPALDLRSGYEFEFNKPGQRLELRALGLEGDQNGAPLLQLSLASPMTLAWGGASNATSDSSLNLQVTNLNFADWKPLLGDSTPVGRVNLGALLTARFSQNDDTQSVIGNLRLLDFTGQIASNHFNAFAGNLDFDLSKSSNQIAIHQVTAQLTPHGRSGGRIHLSGTCDTSRNAANVEVTLTDLNEIGLRPFLQPLLHPQELASITLNGQAGVQYDPDAPSILQAGLQMTNLVVNDPRRPQAAPPLEAALELDTSLHQNQADVRLLQVSLTPTARAQNQMQLQGKLDFSNANAIQGNAKLTAESLDVTPYYNLFATQEPTQPETPAPPQQPAPAPSPTTEPDQLQLPFRNFNLETSIGRLFLRETAISNLQTTLALDAHRALLKPVQLSLNGAPVTATVDLDTSVPGYKYAIQFDAERVAFAPLVDTFVPERKGQMSGTLDAHATVQGAGITGVNLQKSLTGQFELAATNLNLSIANVRSPLLKTIVNVVATLPELLKNPSGAIGTLLGGLTGQGGLTTELTQSPIDVIAARGDAGHGNVNLEKALITSSAFLAEAHGTIQIADVLENSRLNLPVKLSLSQDLARRLSLAGDTNAAYVPLPEFLTVSGTLDDAKADINRRVLVGLTLRAIPGTDLPGQVLRGVGDILGTPRGATNAPGINPPATNTPPVRKLLDNLLRQGR